LYTKAKGSLSSIECKDEKESIVVVL